MADFKAGNTIKFTDFAKCRIVMEALMMGMSVELKLNGLKRTVKMIEDIPYIETVETNSETKESKPKLLGIDEFMTLSSFIDICKKIDNETMVLIGGNVALTKINRPKERTVHCVEE